MSIPGTCIPVLSMLSPSGLTALHSTHLVLIIGVAAEFMETVDEHWLVLPGGVHKRSVTRRLKKKKDTLLVTSASPILKVTYLFSIITYFGLIVFLCYVIQGKEIQIYPRKKRNIQNTIIYCNK